MTPSDIAAWANSLSGEDVAVLVAVADEVAASAAAFAREQQKAGHAAAANQLGLIGLKLSYALRAIRARLHQDGQPAALPAPVEPAPAAKAPPPKRDGKKGGAA